MWMYWIPQSRTLKMVQTVNFMPRISYGNKTLKETKVRHCPVTYHCGASDKGCETGLPRAHATGPTAESVQGCTWNTSIRPDTTCLGGSWRKQASCSPHRGRTLAPCPPSAWASSQLWARPAASLSPASALEGQRCAFTRGHLPEPCTHTTPHCLTHFKFPPAPGQLRKKKSSRLL